MSLTPRQHVNIFCSLQLDRVKAYVSHQTPPDLHRLPSGPLISGVLPPRDLREERSVPRQLHRANRRSWDDLKPSERRKRVYSQRYHAMKQAQMDLFTPRGES